MAEILCPVAGLVICRAIGKVRKFDLDLKAGLGETWFTRFHREPPQRSYSTRR